MAFTSLVTADPQSSRVVGAERLGAIDAQRWPSFARVQLNVEPIDEQLQIGRHSSSCSQKQFQSNTWIANTLNSRMSLVVVAAPQSTVIITDPTAIAGYE